MLPFSDQNQRLSGLCSLHSDSNLTIQNCLGYGPSSRWDEETPLFHTQEHSTHRRVLVSVLLHRVPLNLQ